MSIFYVKPKIAPSKGVLNTTEKCPYCLRGFMDFMDIGRTLGLKSGVFLGCYACGGVFISQEGCASEMSGKKAMLEIQNHEPPMYDFDTKTFIKDPKDVVPEETNEQSTDPIFDITFNGKKVGVPIVLSGQRHGKTVPPEDAFTTKCGIEKPTDKKRKQHEKMCNKCKAIE